VRSTYGIDAEILHPPPAVMPDHAMQPSDGIEPGFWLTVSRLLPYKNIAQIASAFSSLPNEQLVVAGDGPEGPSLRAAAEQNVRFLGRVSDPELAWLYSNCRGLVAASFEDYGLTPVEANAFGKPVVALAWGGHLDTVVDGLNGIFFEQPTHSEIALAIRKATTTSWSGSEIAQHAERFGEEAFIRRIRAVVDEERRAS
jgi:glycosyltransferase involved in cell wall biosynthesis